ncbi:protein fantom isoform X1 [Alosa sapidissima]|uniref:protein fantom isoform X1 n=2 Tax=Alosa sapidissima TaxID=34773 RepID=UPI001C0A3F9F|nr:protein fantom isoform X1 [Alosa sapidissima]XP_041965835.1 protein fantom isoform X1 [Alosa sapidissima]
MSRSSFADETAGDAPVRDMSLNLTGVGTPEYLTTQNAKARQAVSKVSREELEDRFLRLHEENLLLKQHTHKQEDKIKRMATKLIRLVKDRKRMEQTSSGVVAGRDVELEEMIEELQEKVHQLEKQNEGLKQRLLTAKQQLQVQSRRPTPYGHVQSRINTGLRRLRDDFPAMPEDTANTLTRATRSAEADIGARPPHGLLPRYGHSLLDDARAEIRNLENVIENQGAQMEEMERMTEACREQLRRKEREYEESLLQLREQQASGQRSTIKENVELIKLQKQLADKGNAFIVLEERLLQLQESQRTLKASHDMVMTKVDELTEQLREERLKNLNLEGQLQLKVLEQRRIEELKDQIVDLEKERDLLKENCDKLVNSAFDVSQEQKWKTREQQLKLQITQLEMALKSDLTDKNEILDKIKAERDTNEKLSQENSQLQLRYLEQKQQLEELQERMAFFTKESDVDAAELSEALMLIKVRKVQKRGDLDFLEREPSGEHSMKELQATHAETVEELEKTRNLLFMQHKINKDYQAEVEAVNRKLDDLKLESQMKLEKLAHLLDMRAAKIRKLEAQLRDIAYGTKSHVFRPEVTEEDTADEFDETINLERGENLLEIHLGNARLSPEALGKLGDPDPTTFCTFAFFDFEIQSTPVVRGAHPAYNFTSQYLVRMDDLFLQYLHTSTVVVETQLAEGVDYRTVAAGHLRLNQLLDRNGKVFGTLHLVGVEGETQAFGTLDYWLRLRVPMEQAIRLYKERIKAMGYLSSSMNQDSQSASVNPSPSLTEGSLNELYVTVRCCSNLKSRELGNCQPSPYVVYKLYDFPDHDTPIIASSNNAYFDDCKGFPLEMNADLDRYLRAETLFFYVFDDQDAGEQLYLGKAGVPLLSLAHDKSITGTFELADPAGCRSGHIEVMLKWKYTYLPPPGSAVTPEQAKFIVKNTPVKVTTKAKHSDEEEKEEQREEEPKQKAPPQTHVHSQRTLSVTPLPKPRQLISLKASSKKVSFRDVTTEDHPVEESGPSGAENSRIINPETTRVPAAPQAVEVMQPACADEEEEDEEESHFSEGQVIASSSLSISEESEISEEIPKQEMDDQQMDSSEVNELILSDSDDCIVPGHSTQNRKQPSERIRVEVVSLTLQAGSRVAADKDITRLFVEYSILDLPSIETPLSLPKPLPGQSIHYNYSNVIHVDVEKNQARRQALRAVLEGRTKRFESIKFTVVSDPPEEEEQEQECEDVAVAYLRIPDILERKQDMVDVPLNIVDIADSSEVVGSLKVTVEALHALKSIMEDPDHDHPIAALA